MFVKSARRAWAMRLVVAAALVFLTQAAMAQSAPVQTVRMWTWMRLDGKSGREQVMKKLVAGFEAANPGIRIAVESQDYHTITEKFMAAAQTGTAPDVVWLYAAHLWGVLHLHALANLDDLFVKHWSKEDIADIDGPLWRYGATPTAHYQITHSHSIIGFFYRTDLFKEAGIDPKSLTTWNRFIAAAQKLTVKDAGGNVTRWGFGQTFTGAIPVAPIEFSILLDKDGALFDKDLHPLWSTPAGVQGLEMQADMIRKYNVTPPTAVTMIGDDMYEQFGAGRFAIVRGPSTRLPVALAALGPGKVGYLPTPSFVEGKYAPSEVGAWSVGIWSGSKEKEAAGKFLEYISTRQSDTLWVKEAGQMPIRQSTIADNADFFADPNNAYLALAARDLREHGWLPPEGVGNGGWNEGLNAAFQDVMTHGTDPKTALETAETAFRRAHR